MEQRIEKKFFLSERLAFELGFQILAILRGILAIGTQCVKRQPLDLTQKEGKRFPNRLS